MTVLSYLSDCSVPVQVAAGIGGFLAFVMLVLPVLQELHYRLLVLLNHNKLGVKAPQTFWDVPFGIRSFLYVYKGFELECFSQRIAERFNGNAQLSGRFQGLGMFAFWTVDPENIKTVLATHFKDFSLGTRHYHFQQLLGDGIFTLDSSGWSHSRAMLRPQFSKEQISHVEMLETHVQKVIQIFKENPHEYKNIQKYMFMFTTDSATEFLYGESVALLSGGNPKVPFAQKFSESFNRAQIILNKKSNAQKFHFLFNSKEFRDDCEQVKRFTESYVKLALKRTEKELKEPAPSYIFLDELAKETRDPVILRDQALNILLAGRDTTASLLSFVFLELGKNPHYYDRLRAEILEHFGTSTADISFASLKRLIFLRNFINETLRLYPTVPNNYRSSIRDTTLPRGGGPDGKSPIFIPKGSIVMYSVYSMHHNKVIWGEDAEVFDPDRWTDPRPNAHHWDFLPFNGGPRICLGQQFALTEASYVIVRMLQSFEKMELRPGIGQLLPVDQRLKTALTLSVGGGADAVPVRFT